MWRILVITLFRLACLLGVDVSWDSWLGRAYIGAMFRRVRWWA